MCFGLQGYGGKSAISLTEWQTTRGKSPWMAILGATRQDAARLRPVRLRTLAPIPLVKSDLKTSPETISKPQRPHFMLTSAAPYTLSQGWTVTSKPHPLCYLNYYTHFMHNIQYLLFFMHKTENLF